MKILHLEFGKNLYGGALQVAYLIGELASTENIECHVSTPVGGALLEHLADNGTVKKHPIPISGETDFRVYFRLNETLRVVKPDLIHIHSRRGADVWGVLLARRHKIPYILTRRVDNRDVRLMLKWRAAKAFRVVGISQKICDIMISSGLEKDKVSCIMSRVDTEAYQPVRDPSYLEKALGIAPDVPTVAMIAHLIERKGHDVLLKAIPDILTAHPKTQFLIFGKGRKLEALESILADKPWREQVNFLGFRKDLDKIIPCLKVVVHPAYTEGLGVSLLQAASCAIPIVGSRAGGIPEIVRHGKNGFLIEPGDDKALAKYVVRLLGDSGLRKKMGLCGRKIAEEEFTIPGMATAYLELYRQALAK